MPLELLTLGLVCDSSRILCSVVMHSIVPSDGNVYVYQLSVDRHHVHVMTNYLPVVGVLYMMPTCRYL
jgi:hypothetical protein